MSMFSNPVRLSFYGVAIYGLVGISLPFWPLWLRDHGVTPQGIGLLIAISYFVRMVTGPGFSYLADHKGDRRAPIIWLSLAHLVALSLFWFGGHSFLLILLISIAATAVAAPLVPLVESLTMAWVTTKGYDYGRIRLWGSLSFIVLSMGAGAIITPLGSDAVLIGMMVLAAMTIAAGIALPADPRKGTPAHHARITPRALAALLTDPKYVVFLIAASAIMSSHAVYYAFGTLNWRGLGYSNGFIGFLWALGVLAEVGLFAVSGTLFRRFSPPVLILMGAGAAILRWTLTALDPYWLLLIPLQCLHAFTFGAVHLGVMLFISRAVPVHLAASAQGIYAAVSGGIVMGVVSLSIGPAFEAFGSNAFFFMALAGAVGAIASMLLMRMWRQTPAD